MDDFGRGPYCVVGLIGKWARPTWDDGVATVRVDAKGRLTLPEKLRQELDIAPGDTLFYVKQGNELRLTKAISPFDLLAEQAIVEHLAGRTLPLGDHRKRRAKRAR